MDGMETTGFKFEQPSNYQANDKLISNMCLYKILLQAGISGRLLESY